VHTLSETLKTLFPNSIYLLQDDYIIYLVSRAGPPTLSPDQIAGWEIYLGKMGLKVGVSSAFESPEEAGSYLGQAKHALELGGRFGEKHCVLLYDHLRLLDIAACIAKQDDPLMFCYPSLVRLISEKDAEEQPVLARTLWVYLEHGLSIAETCKALFIHRNTLYYRLEQIWKRLGCQPNDPIVLSQLPVSFSILRYLGKWEDMPDLHPDVAGS